MIGNWWVKANNCSISRELSDKRKSGVKPRFGFKGFLCNTCKKVWETSYVTNERKTKLHKYHDFPTYGLERKTCLPCEIK